MAATSKWMADELIIGQNTGSRKVDSCCRPWKTVLFPRGRQPGGEERNQQKNLGKRAHDVCIETVVEGTIPDYVSRMVGISNGILGFDSPKFNRRRSPSRRSIDCFRRYTREKQIFIVQPDGENGFFPGVWEYARHFRGRGSEGKRQINVEIEIRQGIEIEIRLNRQRERRWSSFLGR